MKEEELLPSVQRGKAAGSGVVGGGGFDLPTVSEDRKTQRACCSSNGERKKGKILNVKQLINYFVCVCKSRLIGGGPISEGVCIRG